MVAVAQRSDKAGLFVQLGGHTLVVVIGDIFVEHGAVEVVMAQSVFLACNGAAFGGVDVHDAVGIAARGMHRAVDHEAGAVDTMSTVVLYRAVDIDAHQVAGGDFGVVKPERVDQVLGWLTG